jgi:hypothetical protein
MINNQLLIVSYCFAVINFTIYNKSNVQDAIISSQVIKNQEKKCWSTQTETTVRIHLTGAIWHIGRLVVRDFNDEVVEDLDIELNPTYAIYTMDKTKLKRGSYSYEVISKDDHFQNTFEIQ